MATTTTIRPAVIRTRWASVAGVVFAAANVYTIAAGADLAPVLAASAVVYLGAAALRRPSSAWPMFFASGAVIAVATATRAFDATWVLLAFGVLLAGYGLVTGALRPSHGLPLQTLGLLAFGGLAAGAVLVDPVLGAYFVAAGLYGHAAWDLHHHRTDRVVIRSMAEFCVVLDTLLATAIVLLTVLN